MGRGNGSVYEVRWAIRDNYWGWLSGRYLGFIILLALFFVYNWKATIERKKKVISYQQQHKNESGIMYEFLKNKNTSYSNVHRMKKILIICQNLIR